MRETCPPTPPRCVTWLRCVTSLRCVTWLDYFENTFLLYERYVSPDSPKMCLVTQMCDVTRTPSEPWEKFYIHSQEPYIHSKEETQIYNVTRMCDVTHTSSYQSEKSNAQHKSEKSRINLRKVLYTLSRALFTYTQKNPIYTHRAIYTPKRALHTLKRAIYTLKRALIYDQKSCISRYLK